MSWENSTLSEISLIGDGAHASLKRVDSGIPYLTAKNITKSGVDYSNMDYISEETYNKHFMEKSNALTQPKTDDILYSIIGSIGGVYVVRDEKIGISSSVAIFRADREKILPHYLAYFLKSPSFDAQVQAIKGGVAQGFMSLGKLGMVNITYPEDTEYQKRIVDVLSAYDSLIENNQKQIKLLEEAAQRLYKEWFVNLHFPGYEDVEIVDGVPEGWASGVLGDVAINSGKKEKKDKRNNYKYYLPIDCIPKKSLGYVQVNDVSLAKSSLIGFQKGDILFGAMRPYFHKVVVARDKGLTRSTCFVLNATKSSYWSYIAMLLFAKDTVDYATQISVGTTMPYVRWKDMKNMPVIIPDEEIAERFNQQIKPIIDNIASLSEQVILLQQARDRLSPKLMSGEIEV